MPQTLQNGIQTPINSDAYNLTADLATMGNSANVVIPVANQAARDALTLFPGLTVSRLDLPMVPIQIYDGTNWKHQGRNVKTLFNNANMTNRVGTASRLVADFGTPSTAYDRIMIASATFAITAGAIGSGISTIYGATSLMQSLVTNAQGNTPISWSSPGGYILGGYVTTGEILVPANTAPLARLWLYVTSGSITTTISSDTSITQFWTEEYPA